MTWSSKKQDVVARSSIESEYQALASAASELVWLLALFKELGVPLAPGPSFIWCDNTGAASLTSNPVFHARTTHRSGPTLHQRKGGSEDCCSALCAYLRVGCRYVYQAIDDTPVFVSMLQT